MLDLLHDDQVKFQRLHLGQQSLLPAARRGGVIIEVGHVRLTYRSLSAIASGEMMSSRTIAIGDIHGCPKALRALINAVQPTAGDTLVMLGDYVDRGPDAR